MRKKHLINERLNNCRPQDNVYSLIPGERDHNSLKFIDVMLLYILDVLCA